MAHQLMTFLCSSEELLEQARLNEAEDILMAMHDSLDLGTIINEDDPEPIGGIDRIMDGLYDSPPMPALHQRSRRHSPRPVFAIPNPYEWGRAGHLFRCRSMINSNSHNDIAWHRKKRQRTGVQFRPLPDRPWVWVPVSRSKANA